MTFNGLKKDDVVYNSERNEVYVILQVSQLIDGGLSMIVESLECSNLVFLSEDEQYSKLGKHIIVMGSL